MNIERNGPVTMGQLSVLRSLHSYGPAGQRVANLVSLWQVPVGTRTAQVVDAWRQLVEAHESLRTVFEVRHDRPVQIVRRHAVQVPAIEVPGPDIKDGFIRAATARLAARWAANPIDFTTQPPWRAFVATNQGNPHHLVTVVHHIAADYGALQILKRQFQYLLSGASLKPQPQPLDLALAQLADPRLADAAAHWATRWGSFRPEDRYHDDFSTRRRATLYSEEGLRAARRVSRRTGASPQATVLALGALALSRIKRRDQITFGLMTANRLDEHWSSLISSLNQCVPLTVSVDEDQAPDDFLDEVYRGSLDAYLNGCFDVDALATYVRRAGHEEEDPTFFSSHYNFLGAGDGEPPPDSPMRTAVAWRESTQRTGPNFHLVVAIEEGLLIGVGASVDFLPGNLPARLAASIESGLLALADEPPESLRKLRCPPRRDIGKRSS
ncbi:condensation domain-containing protein [Nonomuraea sp. NPDC046802]|uniref:condensation domain-containing protein n=1 Tax=Nonomuraea sp. NPDC046802 TaxID=3154919 RepID=UPI00340640E1